MNLKNNPTLKSSKIRVALTIGDPLGIGPAITLKALKILNEKADLTVIGSRFVLEKQAKALGIKIANQLLDLDNISNKDSPLCRVSAYGGKASIEYLDKALDLLYKNKVDCLVTCPISKEAINQSGFKYSGHTEYLADKTNTKEPLMILLNNKLKFSLLTRHVSIKEVPRLLNINDIEKNIFNSIECLKSLFLVKQPRLVVCGLNPHASDNGLIGKEEKMFFTPAIESLKSKFKGVIIEGPLSADVAISRAFKNSFDCV
ncbi:MAG: 4-hydroxythreonine-4-phosphate dehydrogenase PdxA, partial [Actinobacteria bacterium]|nr:4-hydroxythreonine-4-phosphate dehydrogenase PdxA [Actinomycetota bacterium]